MRSYFLSGKKLLNSSAFPWYKFDLYPNTSTLYSGRHPAQTRMDILAYSDSGNSIFDIVEKTEIKLENVIDEIKILKKEKLIKTKYI